MFECANLARSLPARERKLENIQLITTSHDLLKTSQERKREAALFNENAEAWDALHNSLCFADGSPVFDRAVFKVRDVFAMRLLRNARLINQSGTLARMNSRINLSGSLRRSKYAEISNKTLRRISLKSLARKKSLAVDLDVTLANVIAANRYTRACIRI